MSTEAVPSPQTPELGTVPARSRGSKFPIRFTLVLLLLAAGAAIAFYVRGREHLYTDPRVALVEVLPSESLQGSPAASDLVNRLINKHVLLLHDRALLTQVLQNPDNITHKRWMSGKKEDAVETLLAAVRVWPIPDTNLIALTVDSAGDDSAALAEAIVNQYLENQHQVTQNKQLERSVILNNLKQRYLFRKEELGHKIREMTVQLSVDGMGQPGRLSPKELELADLLYLRGEAERKMLDATTPEAKASLKSQMENASERIDAMKSDLGTLTNTMNEYQTLRDEEQALGEQLNKINQELELIPQQVAESAGEVRWVRHPNR